MLFASIEILIPFIIAAVGTAVAGLWDLFTTEIPDELSVIVIASSLFYWFIYGTMFGNFIPLLASLTIGSAILGIGWLLYVKGKWGGADAFIMASIFYAIPMYPMLTVINEMLPLFFFNYIINLLVVSLAYMILYTIVIGIKNRVVFTYFNEDIKKKWKIVVSIPVALTALMSIAVFASTSIFVIPWEAGIAVFFLMLFYRYAVIIETKHFTRSIPVSKLKKGDVLFRNKMWIGITKSELEEIKKTHKNKEVKIKEGVRFAPVFFLSLVATFLFGNILFFILL